MLAGCYHFAHLFAAFQALEQRLDVALDAEGVLAWRLTQTASSAPALFQSAAKLASEPRPHLGSLYGLMFGVQKSSPARPALLNARASVLTIAAILLIRSSSKAADMRIGFANDVAYANWEPPLANETPGEPATPWRASLHHS